MKGAISTRVLGYLSEAQRYNSWIFERIAPFCGERILEVGCGIGNMTRFFARRDLVVGIDIDTDHIAAAKKAFGSRKNLRFVAKSIEGIDEAWLRRQEFDTVVCLNVLEHIRNDSAVLGKFSRILRPGGRLVMQVPAFRFLYNSFDRNIRHFRRYGRGEIAKKAAAAGFRQEHCSYMNIWGIPGWFVYGSLLARKIVPRQELKCFDRLLPVLKPVDRLFSSIAGLSVIYAGRKK